ncbi:hypothetical protein GCM10010214_12780 [Streptomyces abikoensis]|nr:hypothetical protein GCM10010214_12780 [Streptomyces abikoensis]
MIQTAAAKRLQTVGPKTRLTPGRGKTSLNSFPAAESFGQPGFRPYSSGHARPGHTGRHPSIPGSLQERSLRHATEHLTHAPDAAQELQLPRAGLSHHQQPDLFRAPLDQAHARTAPLERHCLGTPMPSSSHSAAPGPF